MSDFPGRIDLRLVGEVVLFLEVRLLSSPNQSLKRFNVVVLTPDGTIDQQNVLDCNWRRIV